MLSNKKIYNEPFILRQVSRGDENAFGKLFYQYHQQLGAFIFRLTESQTDTQEIVQDIFLKIWLNRKCLLSIENFEAYLFTAARNSALNCLKKMARERVKKLSAYNYVLQTDTTAEEGIFDSLIAEAVEKLPVQQKRVYVLSRHEGLKQQEIAQQLNISLETVKKHMVLALRFLKAYLRTHAEFILIFFIAFL